MASPEAKQKLNTVFVTDVVDYSRLIGDDEFGKSQARFPITCSAQRLGRRIGGISCD
jgi:hypothetical protein